MDNNQLYHWGVKGQKWGVRRFQNADGTLTSAGKKRRRQDDWSEDAKTASELKKKSVNQMSNAELRKLNERQQLENQHAKLNKKTSIGKKAVDAFVATAGTATAVAGAYTTYKKIANSDTAKKIANSDTAKKFSNRAADKLGNAVMRDLEKGLAKPLH